MAEEIHAFVAGQRVAIVSRDRWRPGRIEGFDTIKRALKNYVLTERDKKYTYEGYAYPFKYSDRSSTIEPATEKHQRKIKADKARDLIGDIRWSDAPDDLVLSVVLECGEQLQAEVDRQKAKR